VSKKALLDAVPESRRLTILHEEDGRQFIESRQDCSGIVKAAKAMAELPKGENFRLAALVPETVLNQAFTEGWFHDDNAWKRWMNDPQNRDFRVWDGRA
jgi:hypothetical protein